MKKQLTILMATACILQALAALVPAFAEGYHTVRREEREARHERAKAKEDAFIGDRYRARHHAYEAAREEHRAWKHANGL